MAEILTGTQAVCYGTLLTGAGSVMRSVLALSLCVSVLGHGFVIDPAPRNSIDKDQPLFLNGLTQSYVFLDRLILSNARRNFSEHEWQARLHRVNWSLWLLVHKRDISM